MKLTYSPSRCSSCRSLSQDFQRWSWKQWRFLMWSTSSCRSYWSERIKFYTTVPSSVVDESIEPSSCRWSCTWFVAHALWRIASTARNHSDLSPSTPHAGPRVTWSNRRLLYGLSQCFLGVLRWGLEAVASHSSHLTSSSNCQVQWPDAKIEPDFETVRSSPESWKIRDVPYGQSYSFRPWSLRSCLNQPRAWRFQTCPY